MPGIDESLRETMRLPGARGAALVDWISGLSLGSVGDAPGQDHEAAAAEVAEVARVSAEHRVFAPAGTLTRAEPGRDGPDGTGLEPPVEDVIITTAAAYHVVRFVPTAFDGSVCLHLWLDRAEGNLAMARIRLAEVVDRLVLG